MMLSTLARVGSLWMVLVLGGCSGKTLEGSSADGGGADGSGSGGGGGSGSGSGGGSCRDVALSSFDTSCQNDSDCTSVTTGTLCQGDCLCGGSAINVAGEGAWQKDVAGLGSSECGCPTFGTPRCRGGTCAMCLPGSSCDATTSDAGTSTLDASARMCVNIPASLYTTSCSVDQDCTTLPVGPVCSGQCDCGGIPVNVSGLPAFEMATRGLLLEACPCAAYPVACASGTCKACTGAAGCTDGG